MVGYLLSGNPDILKCASGSLVGVFITPDLDLSNEGIVQGRFIKKRLGTPILSVWKFFWNGYSSSAKHGSWISHFPIFSTFVRLSYIYFWLIFLPHILIKLLFNPYWDLIYVLSWYATMLLDIYFFIGLAGSDFLHYCLDKLTKESKT